MSSATVKADTGSSPRDFELESEAITLIIRKGTPHISKAVVEGAFKKPPGSDSPCCFWNQVLYAPEDVSAMTGSTKKVKRDGSQEATSLEDSPNLVPTPVVSRNWALLTSEMGSLCATPLRTSPLLLGKEGPPPSPG